MWTSASLSRPNNVVAGTFITLGCYLTIVQLLHWRQQKIVDKIVEDVLKTYNNHSTTHNNDSGSFTSEVGITKVDNETRSYQLWHVYRMITSGQLIFESQLSMQSRGLLSTYAIPSISSVLYQTGGFTHNVQRRYADMEILIREIDENPVHEICTTTTADKNGSLIFNDFNKQEESSSFFTDIPDIENNIKSSYLIRAETAFQRINAIHAKYGAMILHRDMLYTISVFMCSRVIWFDSRWSWRRLSNNEKEIVYLLWMERARLMNIDVDAMNWKCYNDVLQFKRDYENKYMKFKECNQIVTFGTIDYFVGAAPSLFLQSLFRPFFRHLLACLQESDRQVTALGLPIPPWGMKLFVDGVLSLRAFIRRRLLPPVSLSWVYRLTNPTSATVVNDLSMCPVLPPKTSSFSSSSTPSLYRRYQLKKKLNFGNKTYSPPTSYAIEELGPMSVEVGLLVKEPVYTGGEGSGRVSNGVVV